MSETTPTPWVATHHEETHQWCIGRPGSAPICELDAFDKRSKEDAALIVTAVNAHEPMKAALAKSRDRVAGMAYSLRREDLFDEADDLDRLTIEIDAALRLAEGEKE